MSKLLCSCGNAISNISYPSDTEGWFISEHDRDEVLGEVSRDVSAYLYAVQIGDADTWLRKYFDAESALVESVEDIVENIMLKKLNLREKSIVECSICGCLWVQAKPYANEYVQFTPQNNSYNKVCLKVIRDDV